MILQNIVMNELEYLDTLKTKGNLGENVGYAVSLLAKYYRSQGDDMKVIRQKLEADLQNYEPGLKNKQRNTYITNALKSVDKRGLNKIDEIYITQKEIDIIMGINTCSNGFKPASMRRLAFTLLCFAKFEIARGKNEPWINCDLRLVYKAARLSGFSSSKYNLCLHELYKRGLVQISPRVDSLNVKVTFVDNENSSETVVKVDDINYAGDYFREYMGVKYIRCQKCGRMVYQSSNRVMYCSDCRVIVNREKTRQRMVKLYRERHNF